MPLGAGAVCSRLSLRLRGWHPICHPRAYEIGISYISVPAPGGKPELRQVRTGRLGCLNPANLLSSPDARSRTEPCTQPLLRGRAPSAGSARRLPPLRFQWLQRAWGFAGDKVPSSLRPLLSTQALEVQPQSAPGSPPLWANSHLRDYWADFAPLLRRRQVKPLSDQSREQKTSL